MKLKHMNILVDSTRNALKSVMQSDIQKGEVYKISDFNLQRKYNLFFEFKSEDVGFFGIGFDEESGIALFNKFADGVITDNLDQELIDSCLEEIANMIKREAELLLSKEKENISIQSINWSKDVDNGDAKRIGIAIIASSDLGQLEMYFIKK